MTRGLLAFILAGHALAQVSTEDGTYAWQTPQMVRECVRSYVSLASAPLVMNRAINPYYIRGDFDGDGRLDLAVAMRSKSDDAVLGIGMCRAAGPPVLLGRIAKGKPFSDDPADSVASTGWAVISRSELQRILQRSNPGRHRHTGIEKVIASSKGELLYMPYEDAEGLIYFLNGRFHWYTINSTELPQLP